MARAKNGEKFAKLEAIAKSLGLTAKVNGQTFDKPVDVAILLYHRKVRVATPTEPATPSHETEVLKKAGLA